MDDSDCEDHVREIGDLPEEILEYILSLLSPYQDYKSAMLVCRQWHKIMLGVIQQEYANFHKAITQCCIEWHLNPPELGASVTERYSHSACYHNKSMYVFGGCTSTSTTFNDLWRFDLATRTWVRPLAIGTYPSPKACATLVAHNDSLILFGGWSHPTPYPLHQAARFFNQLHVYTPATNQWSHVIARSLHSQSPRGTAGHAATVVGDKMVIFGGSHGHGVSCNDVWVLDLEQMIWHCPQPPEPCPLPRYGHTQIGIDDTHIMVIGGCGGPNMQFTDVWVLDMGSEPWMWKKMDVRNPDNIPPQLWCHPACRVGNSVVVLSKTSQLSSPVGTTQSREPSIVQGRQPRLPPMGGQSHDQGSAEGPSCRDRQRPGTSHGAESRRSNFKRRAPDTSESSQDSSSDSDDHVGAVGGLSPHLRGATGTTHRHTLSSTLSGVSGPTSAPRSGMPSVRPNAMKNRQRQLETLKRYEDRIRGQMTRPEVTTSAGEAEDEYKVQNPMFIHVLDISEAISHGRVTWQPVSEDFVGPMPEETIFYTLVEGRGELIMFGGIQTDLNSMQRGISVSSQRVSKDVHFIGARKSLR